MLRTSWGQAANLRTGHSAEDSDSAAGSQPSYEMSLQTLDLPWRFRDTCCCATFHARTTGERQQTLAWHVGESPLSATYTLGAPLEPAPARKPQANPTHVHHVHTDSDFQSVSLQQNRSSPHTTVCRKKPARQASASIGTPRDSGWNLQCELHQNRRRGDEDPATPTL